MFWSLLGRLNPGNHQLDRKDTLQDRLHLVVEECWSRIILEMQRGDCALERGTKQPIYWALGGTAWSRISRWHLHANQISSFPSYVFCKPSDRGTETFWFKNGFSICFYQMLKLMIFFKWLREDLSFMIGLIFTRHSPCWQCDVPCNATLKMAAAAAWSTGKRTNGGRATLWNLQIVYNRWHVVLKERDWGRRRSQDEESQHIHLEILPRNHDPSSH